MNITTNRHIVGRLAAALFLALTIGSFLVSPAGAAKPYEMPAGLDQNGFIRNCRAGGGTTERVGSRIVKCTLPSGSTVTCNFITRECSGTPVPFTQPQGPIVSSDTNGNFVEAEPTATPAVNTGGVIVADSSFSAESRTSRIDVENTDAKFVIDDESE